MIRIFWAIIVSTLIFNNTCINAADQNPLISATKDGNISLIQELILKQELLNKKDSHGQTAVHIAVTNNRPDILNLLVEHGSDVNSRDSEGETPLHKAAILSLPIIAKVLIEKGADTTLLNQRGLTALMISTMSADINLVREISAKRESLNIQNKRGQTALFYTTVKFSNIDTAHQQNIAKHLINRGTNVNIQDNEGKTAVMRAAYDNNSAIIQLLLKAGADRSLADRYGQTPLMLAIMKGHLDALKVLIQDKDKILINATDRAGDTALFFCIPNNFEGTEDAVRIQMAKALIENGADINIKNNEGRTVLMQSAFLDKPDFATLFLSAGSDANIRGNNGETALMLAAAFASHKTVERLHEQSTINAKDEDGMTALHYAVNRDDDPTKIVELLLKYGADVNAQSKMKFTALHFAVWSNNQEVVKLLLESGAEADLKNIHGESASDIAKYNEFYEIYNLINKN